MRNTVIWSFLKFDQETGESNVTLNILYFFAELLQVMKKL
jgi:hypothetical protein